MQTLPEIRQVLRQHLPALRARYGVRALRLFGSRIRGAAHPQSDLDLLVEFERPPDLFAFVALRDELADALGVAVDLVTPGGLDPRIAPAVLREAEPV
jgi:predicted nucleotidyltransferase